MDPSVSFTNLGMFLDENMTLIKDLYKGSYCVYDGWFIDDGDDKCHREIPPIKLHSVDDGENKLIVVEWVNLTTLNQEKDKEDEVEKDWKRVKDDVERDWEKIEDDEDRQYHVELFSNYKGEDDDILTILNKREIIDIINSCKLTEEENKSKDINKSSSSIKEKWIIYHKGWVEKYKSLENIPIFSSRQEAEAYRLNNSGMFNGIKTIIIRPTSASEEEELKDEKKEEIDTTKCFWGLPVGIIELGNKEKKEKDNKDIELHGFVEGKNDKAIRSYFCNMCDKDFENGKAYLSECQDYDLCEGCYNDMVNTSPEEINKLKMFKYKGYCYKHVYEKKDIKMTITFV